MDGISRQLWKVVREAIQDVAAEAGMSRAGATRGLFLRFQSGNPEPDFVRAITKRVVDCITSADFVGGAGWATAEDTFGHNPFIEPIFPRDGVPGRRGACTCDWRGEITTAEEAASAANAHAKKRRDAARATRERAAARMKPPAQGG